MKTIYIGSDHGGLELRQEILIYLMRHGYNALDQGTFEIGAVDYPKYAQMVSISVAKDAGSFGILICKSGNGMTITANKKHGIRAVSYIDKERVVLARQHNDANVICFGAGYITSEKAIEAIAAFIETPFSNEERNQNRILQIESAEELQKSMLGPEILFALGCLLLIVGLFSFNSHSWISSLLRIIAIFGGAIYVATWSYKYAIFSYLEKHKT